MSDILGTTATEASNDEPVSKFTKEMLEGAGDSVYELFRNLREHIDELQQRITNGNAELSKQNAELRNEIKIRDSHIVDLTTQIKKFHDEVVNGE